MDGLTMGFPLTVQALLRRAEQLSAAREIVTRLPDRSIRRSTWGETISRARRLAVGLQGLGIGPGDRVATLCWNHQAHLEAYLGIPAAGAVVHTLNLRLPPDDLAAIAAHGGARVLIVDASLLRLLERFADRAPFERVLVVEDGYEELVAAADGSAYVERDPPESEAVGLCYTTGTTGAPKGVLYSHRSLVLHSLGSCLVDGLGVREADTILPVVPMFHVNAWGLPYSALLAGAKLVLPGPHLDPASLLELLDAERVTLTAGVPTIWLGVLQALDAEPGRYDLSALRAMVVGGSAAPRSLIEGYRERHGVPVLHAWGMTETSPVGTVAHLVSALDGAPAEERGAAAAKQGRPVPLVEVRARGAEGLVPWDGEGLGELEVRGPWVASAYYGVPEGDDRFTEDGWFRTGDIVTIDPLGYVEIVDRAKDLIKSGGEWISSVALESALMGHPAVAEAAVIAVPDPKWQERPLAAYVLKPGAEASADELRAHLAARFPSWMLPDRFERLDELPKTAAGKFRKSALRERFA